MSSQSGTSSSDADAAAGATGVTGGHEEEVHVVNDNSENDDEEGSIGREIAAIDDEISLNYQADIEG